MAPCNVVEPPTGDAPGLLVNSGSKAPYATSVALTSGHEVLELAFAPGGASS